MGNVTFHVEMFMFYVLMHWCRIIPICASSVWLLFDVITPLSFTNQKIVANLSGFTRPSKGTSMLAFDYTSCPTLFS